MKTDQQILDEMRARADHVDQTAQWPAQDLAALAAAGDLRAAIPRDLGGDDRSGLEIYLRYEQIASASLAVALILSQRNSACSLIDTAERFADREHILRDLATNEYWITLSIAQLTTSRQRGAPAVIARRSGDGYRLSGVIPWSTGAAHSRYIVAGAVLEDSHQQILFLLPRDLEGIRVEAAMDLVALKCTHTSSITCDHAQLDAKWLLHGAAEQVLGARKRHLSIGQSFLATGLCRNAIDLMTEIDSPASRDVQLQFESQLALLRDQVIEFSKIGSTDAERATQLRGRCNELAVRVTHAAVTLYKGAGLVMGHPAQRLARESMFMLVWACPTPVLDCTTQLLSSRE